MKRKSQITAFSLPRETQNILNNLQEKSHKTRSELLREMIKFYVASGKNSRKLVTDRGVPSEKIVDFDNTNTLLRHYYQLISSNQSQQPKIIAHALINKKSQILIGERTSSTDLFIKDMSWSFPAVVLNSLEFENDLIRQVKADTGLKIHVLKLVFARLSPDLPIRPRMRIIDLYYHCQISEGKQKNGEKFTSLKWTPANHLHHFFTTSIPDDITLFLNSL
jgi:ADP-ribose pyrophosphatase YjhB (NUDIX family)